MVSPDSSPQFQSFPTTRWSYILSAREENLTERNRAWEHLATTYWKPAYAFIRACTGRSDEEARDLTQDLFVWMMESALIHRADPERGRFRSLLKVAIRRFLIDAARHRNRVKRGGERRVLSLDLASQELPSIDPPDLQGRTPEEILNLTWRREVLARTIAVLEQRYRAEDRSVYFQIFRDYFLEKAEDPDYAALAAKYGLKVSDISNYLVHAKQRYRTVLEELVADTVESQEELREELAWLLAPDNP